MLSSITINCQVTNIVMNPGSQLFREDTSEKNTLYVISVSNVTSHKLKTKVEHKVGGKVENKLSKS